MAREIDERVVEMRFNNKEFELNAKTSMNTLQRLKEALNFTKSADSLKALGKAVPRTQMDQLVSGVDALQKRFSVFGIMSMRAVENVTDSLMGMAKKGVKTVEDSIISGGIRRAMNLEKAHFQLQNIIGDEAKVQKVMDAANKSVDGTAYSFDVAAKAASQFYASGITDSKSMDAALRGLAGTSATFSASYDQMAMIWSQVAGKGRVMGDELLQLSSRGINAAVEITKFMNGVNDGSIKASKRVTKAVRSVTEATDLTETELRDMVSKGKINFEIFAEAMSHSFGDSAQKANETFDGALSNIKAALARIGAEFISPLIAQNSEVVKLFNTMREKVNDIKAALTLSDETAGFKSLSKRFTDSVLIISKASSKFIKNFDFKKPINIFYDFVDIFVNSAKAIQKILKPISKAFRQVFLKDLNYDNIKKFTNKLVDLTSEMKLSKKNSDNLHDAFKGIFDLAKLISDALLSVLKAIIPINKPVKTLSELFLELAGSTGRSLSAFTEWISKSEFINKAYTTFGKAVGFASKGISTILNNFGKLIKFVAGMPQFQKVFDNITNVINYFGSKGSDFLDIFTEVFKKFVGVISDMDLTKPAKTIERFIEPLKRLLGFTVKNDGLSTFTRDAKTFKYEAASAFDFGSLIGKIEKFIEVIKKLVGWFRDNVISLFTDLDGESLAAIGMAGGMIFSIVKLSKAIENAASIIAKSGGLFGALHEVAQSIKSVSGSITSALSSYQKDLNANAIIKIAAAIAILAAALAVLSFTDTKRLAIAALSLSVVAGVFLFGTSKLMEAFAKAEKAKTAGNRTIDILEGLGTRLGKAVKQLAKAVKYKAIGSMFKDFGFSIATIVGSVILLSETYKNDSASVESALDILGEIVAVIVGVVAVMSGIQKLMGKGLENNVLLPTLSVLSIALTLGTVVKALIKLFKVKLPKDWELKLDILSGIFLGLGALSALLTVAAGLTGGSKSTGNHLISIAASMYLVVVTLEKLMEMEFTPGWVAKVIILGGIFTALSALIVIMSAASYISGGSIKAGTTLLALAVMVGVIVAALGVLMIFPIKRLTVAAFELGFLLLAIGGALAGAGKITEPSAYKSVLAMAILIGSIVVSLTILSIMPFDKLLKSALILGTLLITTALNFSQIGKITGESNWKSIVSMVAAIGIISLGLFALASRPWDSLLAAGAALGTVLLALAGAFKVISDTGTVDVNQILKFGLMTVALLPITASLVILSQNNWQSILAAGVAISLVVGVFGGIFTLISGVHPNLASIGIFILASASIAIIGASLYLLAQRDWQSILAAGVSVTAVLLAMSKALAICTVVGAAAPQAIAGIALLDIFIANFAAVLVALGKVFESEGAKQLLSGGVEVFGKFGEAIGKFVGGFAGNVLNGIGTQLSDFMSEAGSFFEGVKKIDAKSMEGMKYLAQTIGILTADDIFGRINEFFGGDSNVLKSFGEQIVGFAPYIKTFATEISGIKPEAIEGASSAVAIMAKLAESTPKKGGLIGWLTGEHTDLSTFGSGLEGLATGLKKFSKKTEGITEESVSQATSAANMVVKLSKAVPKEGGLWGMLTGNRDMSSFGDNLESFGTSLVGFATTVQGVETEGINAVTKSMNAFIKMAKQANKTSAEGVKNLSKSMDEASEVSASKVTKSTSKSGESISKSVKNSVSKAADEISKTSSKFQKEGKKSIDKYTEGVKSKEAKAKSAGKNVASKSVTGIKDKYSEFLNSGKYAGAGYVEGIRDKIPAAKQAGKELAEASQKALKKKNDEGSPSKEFIKSGRFASLGYIIGMSRLINKARETGEELGEKSQDGIIKGYSKINRIFSELDANPIITPSVDISGVKAAAGSISSMFNNAINMTASAVGSISVTSNRSETAQLADALKGLELQAAGGGGNTYNINGISYQEGSDVASAIETLVGATLVQRRV